MVVDAGETTATGQTRKMITVGEDTRMTVIVIVGAGRIGVMKTTKDGTGGLARGMRGTGHALEHPSGK